MNELFICKNNKVCKQQCTGEDFLKLSIRAKVKLPLTQIYGLNSVLHELSRETDIALKYILAFGHHLALQTRGLQRARLHATIAQNPISRHFSHEQSDLDGHYFSKMKKQGYIYTVSQLLVCDVQLLGVRLVFRVILAASRRCAL